MPKKSAKKATAKKPAMPMKGKMPMKPMMPGMKKAMKSGRSGY